MAVTLPSIDMKPRNPTGIIALAFTITCIGSTHSVRAELPRLTEFHSTHYTLHTNLPRKKAARYAGHMDLVFADYSKRFRGFRDRRRGRQPLYLFRTREQYVNQLGAFGFDARASGGMFFRSSEVSGLATYVGEQSDDQVFGTLQHEGFHQFASNYIGRDLPIWVNEGLAEYFEQALIVNGKVKLGLADERRVSEIKDGIANGLLIDFDELLTITGRQWSENMRQDRAQGRMQYVQSWSIVYFLIHADGRKYQQPFQRYLLLISKGRRSDKAFRTAFKARDTIAFRKRWERFVLKLEPDFLSTAVKRMQFLGQGLRWLGSHDLPVPDSLDALRASLQEKAFHLVYFSDSGLHKVSAKDDALFTYRDRKGDVREFEVHPLSDRQPLPVLTAPGLKPEPVLHWSKDEEGRLVQKIDYR